MDWTWLNDVIGWWTTDRVVAAGTVAAVVVAGIATRSGVKTLHQARLDSEARSRPMVAAELRAHPLVEGVQLLVIRNYGPSIARNVKVTFDPEFPDQGEASPVVSFLRKRYTEPVPALTPGMELDNVYYWDDDPAPEQIPAQVVVTISYDNAHDPTTPYVEAFHLDTGLLRNRTVITTTKDPSVKMAEVSKSLKSIDATLKARRRPPALPDIPPLRDLGLTFPARPGTQTNDDG